MILLLLLLGIAQAAQPEIIHDNIGNRTCSHPMVLVAGQLDGSSPRDVYIDCCWECDAFDQARITEILCRGEKEYNLGSYHLECPNTSYMDIEANPALLNYTGDVYLHLWGHDIPLPSPLDGAAKWFLSSFS